MPDGKSKALRIAARVVIAMSLAAQMLIVFFAWWAFVPRFSCGHLVYWSEWIACLQGESASPIFVAAGCVVFWIVAGIGAPLGRYLPPYISVIVPLGMLVALVWLGYENLWLLAEPQPPLLSILVIAMGAGLSALVLVGPSAGAWLWGLSRRSRRRSLLRLSTVFDSAK
jgi:hypothetical protein